MLYNSKSKLLEVERILLSLAASWCGGLLQECCVLHQILV